VLVLVAPVIVPRRSSAIPGQRLVSVFVSRSRSHECRRVPDFVDFGEDPPVLQVGEAVLVSGGGYVERSSGCPDPLP